MKKIFSLGLMLAALTLTNCSKDAVEEHVMPAGSADFEIFASTDEGRTANEGLKTVWKGGDQVNLFHSNSDGTYFSNGAFTIAEEDVATNRFTGKTAYELGADSLYNWYMIYPYKSFIKDPANEEDPENNIGGYFYIGSRSDSSQHQTEPDNMKHIAGTDVPLYGFVADVLGSEKPMLTMKHVTSVVEFNISNPTANDLTVTEIALTAPEAICGSFYPHFTADGQFSMTNHPTYTASTARLSITDGVVLAGESATFYMVVKPFALAADKELTIKVTADAGVCTKTITGKATTFTAGKIKTINFTYVAPVVEQKTWSLITSVDDLVDGKYVILAKDQAGTIGYLPAEATTTNPRFPSQEIFDTTTNTYSASVPEEMIWNFAQNAAGNWVITTNGGDYFYGINDAQGLKVGDTEDAWTITTHSKNAAAVTFRNDDVARNAGVYHKDGVGNSWRSYNGDTYQNYGTNGVGAQIILYYCGTIAQKTKLDTPAVTVTSVSETSISVSWEAVDHTSKYLVTNGIEEATTTNTSYEFTELEPGTSYTISVVAQPEDDSTEYAKSEAGIVTATTTATAGAAVYTKITNASELVDGKYLIVYESGKIAADGSKAGSGIGASGVKVSVTINNGSITGNESIDAAVFTITKDGDKYAVKNSAGEYINSATNKNGIIAATSPNHLCTISIESNVAKIANFDKTTVLVYNTQGFFRFYKNSTVSGNPSSYPYPALYKLQ